MIFQLGRMWIEKHRGVLWLLRLRAGVRRLRRWREQFPHLPLKPSGLQLTEFMLGSLVLGPCAGGAAWKVIAHLGALPEGRVGALGTEAWTCTISALCFSLHFCSAKAVLSRDSSQPQALQHTAEARERATAHTLPLPRRSRQVHADLPGNTQACRLW